MSRNATQVLYQGRALNARFFIIPILSHNSGDGLKPSQKLDAGELATGWTVLSENTRLYSGYGIRVGALLVSS